MPNLVNYPNGDPIARSAGSNAASSPMHFVMVNTLEAARLGSAAIADTIEMLTIPAGTLVTSVCLEVIDTEATVTIAVGDDTDPDGWIEAATVAAAGYRLGGGAYAGNKLYTADTKLKLLVAAAALTSAKLRLVVTGVSLG